MVAMTHLTDSEMSQPANRGFTKRIGCATLSCNRQHKADHEARMIRRNRPAVGSIAFLSVMILLGLYFTFAAVQGDYGVFRRAEVNAEADQLRVELAALSAEVARMENLTHRLSDAYLDLDLLDQQARDVLGMIRSDEIVIR